MSRLWKGIHEPRNLSLVLEKCWRDEWKNKETQHLIFGCVDEFARHQWIEVVFVLKCSSLEDSPDPPLASTHPMTCRQRKVRQASFWVSEGIRVWER